MLKGNVPVDLASKLNRYFSVKKYQFKSRKKSPNYIVAAAEVLLFVDKYERVGVISDKRRFLKAVGFIRQLRAADPRACTFLTITPAIRLVDNCRSITRRELMRILKRPIIVSSRRGALTLMNDFMVSQSPGASIYSQSEITVFEMDSI